jgi:hypothetical protein
MLDTIQIHADVQYRPTSCSLLPCSPLQPLLYVCFLFLVEFQLDLHSSFALLLLFRVSTFLSQIQRRWTYLEYLPMNDQPSRLCLLLLKSFLLLKPKRPIHRRLDLRISFTSKRYSFKKTYLVPTYVTARAILSAQTPGVRCRLTYLLRE